MQLRALLLMTGAALSGCSTLTVTYPVCGYSYTEAGDWQRFEGATKAAVSSYFGSETAFLLSPSQRTLTVTGQQSSHERFIPWLAVEACIPNYGNSIDRGAFVVCSAFMERAAAAAIAYARAGRDDSPGSPKYSDILRDMDKQFLGCQQNWPKFP